MRNKNVCAMPMLAAVAACLLSLTFAAPGAAQRGGELVDCRMEAAGKIEVNGKCRVTAETGGSFTLENVDPKKPLYGSILSVTVSIVSPGVAEVRGLTRQGVNSRWGQARRSNEDRACWEGSDFRICAGASAAQGDGKLVHCRAESGGKVEVDRECRFTAEAGGSFTLQDADPKKPLYGSILAVTVSIVSPGVADARGLTRDGINSRWGAARRSRQDRSCWDGSGFRICAR